jgi:hypothetical protein
MILFCDSYKGTEKNNEKPVRIFEAGTFRIIRNFTAEPTPPVHGISLV